MVIATGREGPEALYFRLSATPHQVAQGEHFVAVSEHLRQRGFDPQQCADDVGPSKLWTQLVGDRAPECETFEMPGQRERMRWIRVAALYWTSAGRMAAHCYQMSATEGEIASRSHLERAKETASQALGVLPLVAVNTIAVIDEFDPIYPGIAAAVSPIVNERAEAIGGLIGSLRDTRADTKLGHAKIKYGTVSLNVSRSDVDDRIDIDREGMGGTTVNYRADGLSLEVQDESGNIHSTWAIPTDELEADEAAAEGQGQRG